MQIQHTLTDEGFITNVTINPGLRDSRIAIIVRKPGNSELSIDAEVIFRDGEYLPVVTFDEGRYEGNSAHYQAAATMHAYKQVSWFADDLNAFERDCQNYVDKIQEYLDERSKEGLALYMPLFSLSITDGCAKQVLGMVAKSGLFGDLTTALCMSKLNSQTLSAIMLLMESIGSVYYIFPGEEMFMVMADLIKSILESYHA